MCADAGVVPTVVNFDPRKPDIFRIALSVAMSQWLPGTLGHVFVDISGRPMQGIMMTLAAIRETVPPPDVTVLYAEALAYFPEKATVMPARRIRSDRSKIPPAAALSEEMSGNLIPKYFSGSSIAFSSCLMLFAGYEQHRSLGVVDELNPAKLVLLYGAPDRDEWSWRTEYSRQLHEPLKGMRPTAEEVLPTLNPWTTIAALEQYRDVQVVFPLPVRYLPRNYSTGVGRVFSFPLPNSLDVAIFIRQIPAAVSGQR